MRIVAGLLRLPVQPMFWYAVAVHGWAPITLPTTVTSRTTLSKSGAPTSLSAAVAAVATTPRGELVSTADQACPDAEPTATAETP